MYSIQNSRSIVLKTQYCPLLNDVPPNESLYVLLPHLIKSFIHVQDMVVSHSPKIFLNVGHHTLGPWDGIEAK